MSERWHPDQSAKVARRVVVEADLVLDTPAHFGGGTSDGTELFLLEDAAEGGPLLPGASIAGALRHHLLRCELGFWKEHYQRSDGPTHIEELVGEANINKKIEAKTLADLLFGEAFDDNRNQGEHSFVIVDDAIASVFDTDIRDGVKIDGASRTADEGALFSFRVWAAGTRFPLRLELNLPEPNENLNADVMEDLYAGFVLALNGLDDGSIRLGARKHRGYGRFHMEHWRVVEYDMTAPGDLVEWLMDGDKSPSGEGVPKITQIPGLPMLNLDARQFVRMDATFALTDNLLIRAGSDVADMAHLMGRHVTDNPRPVLSGTSVAGAMRARALKIAKWLLGDEDGSHLIDEMFGRHGSNNAEEDERPKEDMTASRVIVEEHYVAGGITDVVQNRVKIDRFTGGAYETGLFGQQPIFAEAENETRVNINLELRIPHHIDPAQADFEIALLLLLLKDAWTGDLPFGGESSVGRGRLVGRRAEIRIKRGRDETCIIEAVEGGLLIENRELLQSYETVLGQFAE